MFAPACGSVETDAAATGDSGSSDAGTDGTDLDSTPHADSGVEPDAPLVDAGDLPPGCLPTVGEATAAIESSTHSALRAAVEEYFDGTVTVYRGTAAASDNAHVLPGYVDGELSGAVIAALRAAEWTQPDELPGFELSIVRESDGKWFWAQRDGSGAGPGVVSMVLEPRTTGGSWGTTDVPLPAFEMRPATLDFDVHAEGRWGNDEPFSADARASLTRFDPEGLTFADVRRLDVSSSLDAYTVQGEHAERETGAALSLPTCTPEGSGFADGECTLTVSYTLVERARVDSPRDTTIEVRDVVPTDHCCVHCDHWGHHGCESGFAQACFP